MPNTITPNNVAANNATPNNVKPNHQETDQDAAKGATETEDHETPGNIGLQEQLGHRDQDPMLKDADSDFPEPGNNPEHSGEPRRKSA